MNKENLNFILLDLLKIVKIKYIPVQSLEGILCLNFSFLENFKVGHITRKKDKNLWTLNI